MSTLISVDYGTKKSGIAYSVEGFCFGWKTVPTKGLIESLQKFAKEKNAQEIIVGMPYNIDGSISVHAKRVQKWIKELEVHVCIPIIPHDERLTTSAARMSFAEDGIFGDLDQESARLILESYIKEREQLDKKNIL